MMTTSISRTSSVTAHPELPSDLNKVYQQLTQLKQLAETSTQHAQQQAWQWLKTLGQQDQQQALAALFSQGIAENPKVKTLGMPVGPMRNVPGGDIITQFLKVDSPWTGKTFAADGTGGYNRIKAYSKLPVTLLCPFHKLHKQGNEYIGFNFDVTLEQGAVEPKVDVIAIQYANPCYKNPSFIIPLTHVRDELVKILPHTYLGRATYLQKNGEYILVGYFALKTAINTSV